LSALEQAVKELPQVKNSDLWDKLAKPFTNEIKERVMHTTKKKEGGKYPKGTKAQMASYVDARNVMERLDEVVGQNNWHDSYIVLDQKTGATECQLTILGITKSDVGYPNSDRDNEPEPLKASFSDSFKRAAVKFGIGRHLYSMPPKWVEIDEWGKPLGNNKPKSVAKPLTPDPATIPMATAPQLKAIYAISQAKGISIEKMKQNLAMEYKVGSSKELTSQQASKVISELNKMADVNPQVDVKAKEVETRLNEALSTDEEVDKALGKADTSDWPDEM